MRRLAIALSLVGFVATAHADRIGPPELYGPVVRTIVPEEPCDLDAPFGDASAFQGTYMCQLGLDGKFYQPYPCEIEKSSWKTGYLAFSKCDMPCNVVGTIVKKSLAFDGSLDCRIDEDDVIGDYAVFGGKMKAIAGGYRLERKIERIVERGYGPSEARRVTETITKPALVVNVCKRPWPKDFKKPEPKRARPKGKHTKIH